MEMEEIKSLMGRVRQLHKDMKDISDKHPEQPVLWDTAKMFNGLLTETKQKIKDQPAIRGIEPLKPPRDDESDCRTLKVVDMVARLSVLKATLEHYLIMHERSIGGHLGADWT